MATLKEFEEALREQGMRQALAILEKLRERDRKQRKVAPARRIAGVRMTPDLALRILEMHRTTSMTQQEIAFELGVNQGRVNEVIKRGKWLTDEDGTIEKITRDKALARMRKGSGAAKAVGKSKSPLKRETSRRESPQLPLF